MSGLRVVLDTNVVLSALIFSGGRLAFLREAWRQSRCQPLVCTPTIVELRRALTYPKFRLTADEQHELLADYLPYAIVVRVPAKPPKVPQCRDPFDLPFLQLAVVGKADHLVTGDKDLLSLAGKFKHSIISPSQLIDLLG